MIKRYIWLVICCLSLSATCFAADSTSAKVTMPADGTPAADAKPDAAVAKPDRFLNIAADDEYQYYMDMQTVQWIRRPYSVKEKLIDVWIKLQPLNKETYSYPETYFLQHYYIRLEKRQIQFLGELEAAGRPNNALVQKAYREEDWEDLVPGSMEETIYQAVVSQGKLIHRHNGPTGIPGVRDQVEEFLRISL